MVVQTQRGNQTDTVDPIMTDLSVQTLGNPRDPPRTALGFTPGIQETGNTSTTAGHTTPGIGIPSTLYT
uniref:Uncharacterized protein n=1 Tax=Cannabis sativa TaxID=3483 RepID=A0A803NLB9_CANSA